MLVLTTVGTPGAGILQLQEVGLRQVDTSGVKCVGVLLFEGLTYHEVGMMQADGTVVGQRVLYQGIGVLAVSLGQTLVLLGQIHTVTLYPGGNPGLVIARGRAIGEVDLISQLMVLALDTDHTQQVDIG